MNHHAWSVDNGIGGGIFKWMTFHDISREFRPIFRWWEWRMMTTRLHYEHWWKCGRSSQILCGHDMYSRALKPSHSLKACVLSNHVKFRRIQTKVEGIWTLAPFITQHAMSIDNGIGGGSFKWMTFHDISREFRQRFHWWELRMTIMRLHDERWWKYGWSQRLCGNDMHPWASKPSHTMKACVLSNHLKFRRIQAKLM